MRPYTKEERETIADAAQMKPDFRTKAQAGADFISLWLNVECKFQLEEFGIGNDSPSKQS